MHCRNQSCVSLFVVPTPCLNYSERWRPLLFSVLQYQPPPEQEFTEENSQLIGFHSSGNEGRLLKSYSLEKYQRRCCTLFRIPLATQVELETSHWLSTFGWIHTIQDSLSAIAMQWPDIPCFFLVFFWQLCLSSHHSSSGAATHPNVSRTLCPGCWAASRGSQNPTNLAQHIEVKERYHVCQTVVQRLSKRSNDFFPKYIKILIRWIHCTQILSYVFVYICLSWCLNSSVVIRCPFDFPGPWTGTATLRRRSGRSYNMIPTSGEDSQLSPFNPFYSMKLKEMMTML